MPKKGVKRKGDEEEKFVYSEGEADPDIYDEEERQELLENDEITAAEEGFMRGRDGPVEGGKKKRMKGHNDDESVELIKEQYQED